MVLQDVAVPVEKIVTQEKAIEVQKVLTPPRMPASVLTMEPGACPRRCTALTAE